MFTEVVMNGSLDFWIIFVKGFFGILIPNESVDEM